MYLCLRVGIWYARVNKHAFLDKPTRSKKNRNKYDCETCKQQMYIVYDKWRQPKHHSRFVRCDNIIGNDPYDPFNPFVPFNSDQLLLFRYLQHVCYCYPNIKSYGHVTINANLN